MKIVWVHQQMGRGELTRCSNELSKDVGRGRIVGKESQQGVKRDHYETVEEPRRLKKERSHAVFCLLWQASPF